jgi:hypothetical protein
MHGYSKSAFERVSTMSNKAKENVDKKAKKAK